MSIRRNLLIAAVSAIVLAGAGPARAHCDSVDGPVAKAVMRALDTGNLYPVLAYAPATAEQEIRASFDQSRKVRGLNNDARQLADRSFMETVIRLHRAGEGAPFTGLKPAGADYGPAIEAADKVVDGGDLKQLLAVMHEVVEHALSERLAHLREIQKAAPREPKSEAEVAHARERISAELGFVTFAETVRQAALGKGAEHHVD